MFVCGFDIKVSFQSAVEEHYIHFSNSFIIHAFTSQSGYVNLVRCMWFETPMKHWTKAFPR